MRGTTEPSTLADVWPTVVGLAVLWASANANQVGVFAVLFIGWAIFDIVTGESHFIQRITRRDHPLVFWTVVGSWMMMSVLWLAYS